MSLLPPEHDAPLPPARPGEGGTRVLTGVPYAQVPGFRPMELDLVLPPGDGAPVVVFLHGGGFRVGSRRSPGPAYDGKHPFELVARQGIAVASVDYRLSGEARWPAQLHDVKAAVRWLRARAGEIGVDGTRIAAWGESAGGHLAAMLGLTAGNPAFEGTVGVAGTAGPVRAVAAWYTPSDLAAVDDPADPESREALLLGAAPATVPQLAAEASPLTHVSPGAPPFLLLHGRADRMVPHELSERLYERLRAAGADAELHLFDGADHLWLGSDAAPEALDRTIAFLRGAL
ncbi:acetyl esterase/lipase [Amycolatopsis bartoniae]|uniref:Lipase n=1 Tax=Amycolatopsis bartoniae TaxID=941986 RepID=A0A8H9IVJ4_9PSEU|nr:alpha/beta hydrolase [Amycolatopsis bartoniae]MBB2940281.1 acetyl esterase/lipase [Amycolatopsis bartoniae]TVT09473.1 alpha/beta hydrolase [Amycolatopsis bartoniae]GHF53534.1 lipase [Amycolatopsis bartoniae]